MRIYCYNSGLLIYSFLFLFTIIHDCRSLPSRSVTTVRHWHWPGLQTDSWLALPACGNSTDNVVWFDGGRRRRKRLKYWAGRLFNGCAAYYRIGDRLLVHLRPRLLNHCGNIYQELSLTCLVVRHSSKAAINAANQLMNLHSLQLIYDDRCPPGTARDRLGLCRRCRRRLLQRRNRHRHLRFRFDHTDTPDKPNRLRPVLLRRSRRSVNAKKPLVLRTSTGKVRVEQLRCPNRISVVASITCLLEMQKPIQCEMISLVVTSFTLIAYLSMPIYVGYVFIQVQSARFLPFLQFHVYHRSALLCSAMRTQAVFASSLWDFEAFREAEKRRRLVQQDMSQRHHKCDFNRRELPNLFFWYGVKENQ
uniref:G_PROTEIN_RECEP_F1_2 domain-containing protein n=1 Tax=Macrostomum lignano TaxID=282301 RepID=A0A1I8GHU3_9PLAT